MNRRTLALGSLVVAAGLSLHCSAARVVRTEPELGRCKFIADVTATSSKPGESPLVKLRQYAADLGADTVYVASESQEEATGKAYDCYTRGPH